MNDVINRPSRDPELFRKSGPAGSSGGQRPDLQDLPFGEYCHTAPGTPCAPAILNHVISVVLAGAPSKIGKSIVQSIVVFMARLHSLGAWTDERFENEAVDENALRLAVLAERNGLVESRPPRSGFQRGPVFLEPTPAASSLGLATEHPPIVRDGVPRPSVDVLHADARNLRQIWYTFAGHCGLLYRLLCLGAEAVCAVSVPLPVYQTSGVAQ